MVWYEKEDRHDWKLYTLICLFIFFLLVVSVLSITSHHPKVVEEPPPPLREAVSNENWYNAKTVMYNVIYRGHERTLYHGCVYTGKKIDLSTCDYKPVEREKFRATRVEVEHIVPASLLPARNFPCWKKGRVECERNDPRAQAMLFDLHNLAPSVGQQNLLRGNIRYGVGKGKFEPTNCVKGDVARVWLYAHDRYGVELFPGELEMFQDWSKLDPVSPWESERERRVRRYTFISNPYVKGQKPDKAGSCPWD